MHKMYITIDINSEEITKENDDNFVQIINNSGSNFLDRELSDDNPNNITYRFKDKLINFDDETFSWPTDFLSKQKFIEQENLEQNRNILHEKLIPLKEEEEQDKLDINNINYEIINNGLSVEPLENKINKDEEIIPNIELNKKLKKPFFQTKKKGRKKKEDNSEKAHNKYSEDNMIKKIIKIIFDRLISFVNIVIDLYIDEDKKNNLKRKIRKTLNKNRREKKNEGLLKPLDFKKVNHLKKDNILNLLKMDLKEFLSQKISSKFDLLKRDSNEIIINEIINDNEIFESIFKLKVEDYLNFYTYKSEIDIIEKIQLMKNVEFERANTVLNTIESNNDKRYYSLFYSMFNSLKRWFINKIGRERNTVKKK